LEIKNTEKELSTLDRLDLLEKISSGTNSALGKDFFKVLVKNISEVLGLYGVWVAEFFEEENKLKALALYAGGKYIENYEYQIKNTPCEPALSWQGVYFIPQDVISLFPKDNDLESFNAVGYIGLALKDDKGNILGHLAALHNKKIENRNKLFSVFNVFGSRAKLELIRIKNEKIISENNEKINRLLNGSFDGIIEFNSNLKITQLNKIASDSLDCDVEKDDIQELNIKDIMTKDSFSKFSDYIIKLNELKDTLPYLKISDKLFFRFKDKKDIPIECSLSYYLHNQKKYYILILREIHNFNYYTVQIDNLTKESEFLKDELNSIYGTSEIIGKSKVLIESLKLVNKVADSNTTVLLTGETGTGKELFARAIHKNSPRNKNLLVKINCAALPPQLIESELFGHEKGAFTGANSKREGKFSLADKGSIFLDEIGELPLELQAKLLRVIQEGEFDPIGSSETKKVDVRIIAATNRNLYDEVSKGNFREDLYYRLNVFPIKIPSLKERGTDIIILADYFIQIYAHKLNKGKIKLTERDHQLLMDYEWKGNVRELQNLMERAVITSSEGKLDLSIILPTVNKSKLINPENKVLTYNDLKALEKSNILKALEKTNWKISGENSASEILKIPSTTLASKIKSLGIKRKFITE